MMCNFTIVYIFIYIIWNARTHISLPANLKNLVIGNRGVHFMYTLHFSLLHASFFHKV